MSQSIEWFESLSAEEQSNALRLFSHFCIQARATTEDGPESIRRAGLRATHTPGSSARTRANRPATRENRRSHSPRRAPQVIPATDRSAGRRRRTSTGALLPRRSQPRMASPVRRHPCRNADLIPRAVAPNGPAAPGETSCSAETVCAPPRLRSARSTARRAALDCLPHRPARLRRLHRKCRRSRRCR